jgi:hypothetical protein
VSWRERLSVASLEAMDPNDPIAPGEVLPLAQEIERLRKLITSMATEIDFAAECRAQGLPELRKWRALVDSARVLGVWPPK